ncbi:hypothetical protein DL98DRAFT_593373 [Cadophora sp. DSE1049]|nr:hypothetical protein DL98DRAFT_593373 [Cadophora sp. DSE1049]
MKVTAISAALAVLLCDLHLHLHHWSTELVDNCARAATGLAGGKQSARLAACSSFQQCTVIPTTLTITTTATSNPMAITQTATVSTLTQVSTVSTTVTLAPARKRDTVEYAGIVIPKVQHQGRAIVSPSATTICPTEVPATASACTGTVRYDSACSCASITKSYTTLAAPSTTITVTSVADPSPVISLVTASTTTTTTVVSTSTPAPLPLDQFYLQLAFPLGSDPASAQHQNQFLVPDTGFGEWSAEAQGSLTNILFMINEATEIVNAGSTGSGQDRVAVAVTVSNQAFAVLGYPSALLSISCHFSLYEVHSRCITFVPGVSAVQCNAAGKTVPAICDANQWNSTGGAGTRPDAFIVFFDRGQGHAGCYTNELAMRASE